MDGHSTLLPQVTEAMAELQVEATSQPWHQLTDPKKSPFGDLPIEIVRLIARCCSSAESMAALDRTSKWLHVIVSPIFHEGILVECHTFVIFWAVKRGYVRILQKIKAAEQRYRAAVTPGTFAAAGLPLNWNSKVTGLVFRSWFDDCIPWPIKDVSRQDDLEAPTWDAENFRCAPLHLAVLNGHLDTIAFLLDNGADIEAVSGGVRIPYRYSPGWWNAAMVVTPFVLAFLLGNCDAVKLLLHRAASEVSLNLGWNFRDIVTTTPLHLLDKVLWTSPSYGSASPEAKKQKLRRLIQVLVQSSCVSINTPDWMGRTPLRYATEMKNATVMEALLASGADPRL